MNNLRKYLILLELISFRRIDFDIIKKKYRELAMRLHPDITGRDTNKEMAEINNAYEFLIRNVSAANEELKNIWKEKEAEFARVYRDAILKDLSSATISQLRRSINLFNTIAGYKDVKDLITKYTAELNKKLKEEARKEAIYKDAILDVRKASIGELEKAISLLKSIPNYKDSNNLILIYKNQIDKLKEEIKQNESYYKKLHQIKNDSISDAEFNKIISFLNSYNAPGSDELLNHFYHRQNQFASVEKRLENERNEKIYVVLLSEFNKARTIKDFKDIISKYTKIKNYKNVDSILSQCKSSIENIIAREEYERKEKLYSEAIEYLKQTKDNSMLQKAIDLLKTIRDFKEAEELIAKAVSLIFDNNEEDRKSKIYNKGVSTFEANDFKLLEDILKELNTVDEYKDIDNLKMEYQSKIDKLKDNLYEEAKIDIDNTTIDVLEKSIIILKKIDDYKDSNKLINLYQKKILSIKKEEEAKKKADLEEVYLRGLIGDDEEVTEKLLKDKIKILLSIQSYKESRKIIQSYKKYLSELQSERRKKQFKKYSLIFVKFYLPILILLFIGFQITTKVIIPDKNYNEGIKLFEEGNYEEVIKLFDRKYKNNKINNLIITAEAGILLKSGDHQSAIIILESINSKINIEYDESKELLSSTLYSDYYPSEKGYSVVRWDLTDFQITIIEKSVFVSLYLKAVWQIDNYIINFNSNGGTLFENVDFNIVTDTIYLPIPTRRGYSFIGWYDNSDFSGNEVSFIERGSFGDVNLYAKWSPNEYNIILNYDYDNIIINSSVKYDSNYKLPSPSRKGYMFMGWYDVDDALIEESDKHNFTHDITLKASWLMMYNIINEGGVDYVYYGSYPQTVVSDTNLINLLNSMSITNSSGYYEYEGHEYAKLTANPFGSNYVFSNGKTIVQNSTYYFKVEPIKWRILENNDKMLTMLTDLILDQEVFYTSKGNRNIDGKKIYANNYEHSTIRAWLNDYFYNKAFNKYSNTIIETSYVDNSASTTYSLNNPYVSNSTYDKLFLLSYQDADTKYFSDSNSRKATATDYAKARYVAVSNGYSSWRLRSPYIYKFNNEYGSPTASRVSYEGNILPPTGYRTFYLDVDEAYSGVRPALTIKID